MGLTKTAISRPVFILMVMLATVLMGFIGYNSMRVELNPDVSFGVVVVTTTYRGAGPDEVNTLISKKVEEAVTGLANLREVVSSSQEGVSVVTLTFEVGTDINVALADVRTKVDSIANQLPDDSDKPVIDKFDSTQDPVLTMAINSDSLSNRQLRDLADNVLKDQFARIKGVAQVSVSGGDVREIQVRLNRDALLRYGIGIVDVQRALAGASLNVPAGRLIEGEREFTVRVLGELNTVEGLRNSFLSVSDQNQRGVIKTFRLGDIAEVVDTNAERRTSSRLNGKEAVVVVVQKAKNGNAVEISNAIRQPQNGGPSLLDKLEKEHGIKFVVSSDTSTNIKESLADLNFALIFGIILVSAVIWMFLHNFRGTMIVAIAIPVCIFATLVAYWAFGFTINNLSMLALSLAIGVLVDDAIVVIENIYRHLTMGEEPVEAAINGRMEIGLAALAITFADVVVFLPIGFMGGIVGQFFKPLGIGYVVAVLSSLMVSFTVTPMLASRWYKKGEDWEHPKGWFAVGFEKVFTAVANVYRRAVRFSLHHRWYFFGGGFAVLFALFMFIGGSFSPDIPTAMKSGMGFVFISWILGGLIVIGNLIFRRKVHLTPLLGALGFTVLFIGAPAVGKMYHTWKGEDVFKFAFTPPQDTGQVNINIETPPGTSLDKTSEIVTNLEKIAIAHPMAEYVTSQLGSKTSGLSAGSTGTQYAQISITLYEKEAMLDHLMFWQKPEGKQRPGSISSETVAAELLKQIGKVPGAKVTVTTGEAFSFGSAIQLAFKSDDRQKLVSTATKVKELLQQGAIEGVINPDLSAKGGKPELQAVPDRARLADMNLSVTDMGAALRTLYEGDNSVKFRQGGNEYDVRVMMDLKDRNDAELISEVPVTFKDGNPVYLKEVANIQNGTGVDKIDRRDRQEEIQVDADLLPGFAAGSVQAKIDSWLKEKNLIPEGVSYRPLGQADAQAREMVYLFGALFLGLILVYMVLASLFNNLIYPLIIQLTQPQAMVGAILALVFTDKTLNIVGFIGIIALIGLVGKNAILLVDYANTLRERGLERFDALVESGGTRLRPIMMTTIALLMGMLPVALAIGRGSEFRETIGITIIGGTLLSTFLTLLVIPCSYTIFDDLTNVIGRIMNRNK